MGVGFGAIVEQTCQGFLGIYIFLMGVLIFVLKGLLWWFVGVEMSVFDMIKSSMS